MKISKQSEDKENIKNWHQWKTICHITFEVSKDKFLKIIFTSKIKNQKQVSFDITKEITIDS